MTKESSQRDLYNYAVPEELIAQSPAKPRDAARLLVYNRSEDSITLDTFRGLPRYLPSKSVLVFNQTRVIPARLWCTKATGGKVQVFYLGHDDRFLYALCDRALALGAQIRFDATHVFTVRDYRDCTYSFETSFPIQRVVEIFERHGTTPIPPYIKHSPLSERSLRVQYQTVFAKQKGSVAAPTASLHFTPRLMKALQRAGHSVVFVTLHVGLGTFASVTDEQLASGRLHEEYFEIDATSARILMEAKQQRRTIIAVGTTVARTLESAADERGVLRRLQGTTDIFIRDSYTWKFVDSLITNFHVPRSSLMMLVATLVGRKRLLEIYDYAIRHWLRLFSFGDGMLIR